jgi:hypothetical protein
VAAVEIGVIAAEGGDFHLDTFLDYQDDPEVGANLTSSREQFPQLGRSSVRGDVKVLRWMVKKEVPDAAADQVGLVSRFAQSPREPNCQLPRG